jgi:Ca2+-binding EF-hand superfamily protein
MCEQGICMGDAPLTELISKIDVDGSGRIDFTEFVAAAIEQDKIIDNEKLRRAFDYFD